MFRLPFSFSLKGKEEAGAERTDETDYCREHGKCVDSSRKGKCLKKTEYAVAFGLRGKAVMNFVEPREFSFYFVFNQIVFYSW